MFSRELLTSDTQSAGVDAATSRFRRQGHAAPRGRYCRADRPSGSPRWASCDPEGGSRVCGQLASPTVPQNMAFFSTPAPQAGCCEKTSLVAQLSFADLRSSLLVVGCHFSRSTNRRLCAAGREGSLSCRRGCTLGRKGQLRAVVSQCAGFWVLFKAPLQDRIARHKFSQDMSHVVLIKHTKHSFVAALPGVPLLTCQGRSVNSGARYP